MLFPVPTQDHPNQQLSFLNVNQNLKQHNQQALRHSLKEHDQSHFGDESLPWRKIRSRSLQPSLRGRDRPTERGRGRSLSIHRLIQTRSREPVRPWIEETIKLKPAVITRKVIERGGEKLETVLKALKLKPSQIERRQLIREELEKVELKSVQREYLNAVLSQIADNEEIEKDDFRAYIYAELQKVKKFEENIQNKEDFKYSDDTSILQLTRQVDEQVMRDALRNVPSKPLPFAKTSQLKQLHHQQDSNYMSQHIETSEDIKIDSTVQQQSPAISNRASADTKLQQMVYSEDTSMMQVDQNYTENVQYTGVPVHWRKPRPPIQAENIQHVDDNVYGLSNTEVEQPVSWRKPRTLNQKMHAEDNAMLYVNESNEIVQTQTVDKPQEARSQDVPVHWRKSRQPNRVQEDISILSTTTTETTHENKPEQLKSHIVGPIEPMADIRVSNTAMVMKMKSSDTKKIQSIIGEPEDCPTFAKNIDMKVASQITKTERRKLVFDDSQPLPELELITQKRIVEASEKRMDASEEPIITSEEYDNPKIVSKLESQTCKLGDTMKMSCTFIGNPMPTICWFFNNSELFSTENVHLSVYENCAELSVVRIEPRYCGIYTCVVSNEKGRAISRATVVIGKYIKYKSTHRLVHCEFWWCNFYLFLCCIYLDAFTAYMLWNFPCYILIPY